LRQLFTCVKKALVRLYLSEEILGSAASEAAEKSFKAGSKNLRDL